MDERIIINKEKRFRGFIYTLQCLKCDKFFKLHGYKFNDGKGRYCSLPCANTCPKHKGNMLKNRPSHKGTKNPNYKNGWTLYKQYKKEFCELCGITLQELKTQKKYKRIPLETHHIDKDRENGNYLNLVVLCCTCHRRLHYRERNKN